MGNFPTLLEYGSGGDVLEDEMFVKWAVIGGNSRWFRTMIPRRYRTPFPAAEQRGRSSEHARARVLPFGFADALLTTFSYSRDGEGAASMASISIWLTTHEARAMERRAWMISLMAYV